MKNILFQLSSALLLFQATAWSKVDIEITLTPVGSFTASAPKVKGAASKRGDLVEAKNIELDIGSLNSGIELRDEHMKNDYFETKKYPKATLKSAKGKSGKFVGILSLRGQDKKISGTFKQNGSNIIAEFKTSLSDFNIKKASYMGVGVKNEVTVKVEVPVK
jgi:polyisoprenoid-binding protein YceI